jgi:cellulose biosynthesis protein BcsQ
MDSTQILAVYSETGGAGKTTTAVSLAKIAADHGLRTLLVDMDPRGAATVWLGATIDPVAPFDVNAILDERDPSGWASDKRFQLDTAWSPLLHVVGASKGLANRDVDLTVQGWRLKASLQGIDADLVVIDCPNRPGGPLVSNALYAATDVLLVAKPSQDGYEGVDGAMETVRDLQLNRQQYGVTEPLTVAGIVICVWTDTITPRDQQHAFDDFTASWGDLVLDPAIPSRVRVLEARTGGVWYGDYVGGEVVADCYLDIARQVIHKMKETRP